MLWVRRGSRRDAPPAGHRPLRRRPRDGAAVLGADRGPPSRGRHAARRRAARPLGGKPGFRSRRPGAARASSHGSWTARKPSSESRRRPRTICSGGTPARASRRSRTASSRPSSRCARRRRGGTTILHSGTLTKDRPLEPLLRALRPPLRLVLHGYVAPEIARRSSGPARTSSSCQPSGWEDAVRRMADADVALVTQARGAGDETAVAAKVYEYLALGKPVLVPVPRRRDRGTASTTRRRPARGTPRRPSVDRGRARQDHGRRPAAAGASGAARAVRAPAPSRASRRPARRARRSSDRRRGRRRSAPTPCRPRAAERCASCAARRAIRSGTSAIRFGSRPSSVFVPIETVIGRSVFARSVKHGSPRYVVSSWMPPESVRAAAEPPTRLRNST